MIPFAADRLNLLRLHNLAAAYHQRPSQILGLETELASWALDEACLMVGRRVENNLAQDKAAFDGFDMPAMKTAQGYESTGHQPVKKVKLDFLNGKK